MVPAIRLTICGQACMMLSLSGSGAAMRPWNCASSVVIDCEVRSVEENRRLSYTWSAYGTETIVTFSLTPVEGGTLLRLEQAGFPAANRAAIKGANASWPTFLTELERLLARID